MSVELTATSATNEHGGLSPEFVSIDRPSTHPLHVKKGDRLRSTTLSGVLAGGPEVDAPGVEWQMQLLVAIARLGDPVVVAFGPLEAGMWVIDDVVIRPLRRQPGSNAVNWADVEVVLTEHKSDPTPPVPIPAVSPTPVPAAPRPPAPTSPAPASPGPRTHTMVSGDTLWELAGRYYRDNAQWRRIADANGIRDTRKIAIGTVVTIP
jgi:LysM repeat protein